MRDSWVTATLKEIIVSSGTIDPRKEPEKKFQYVDVSSVSREKCEIVNPSEIIGKDAPSRARRLIRKGDVLLATVRPTLKRVAIVSGKLDGEVCSTGYFVFRTKPEIDNKFLFYYLLTDEFMEAMKSLQSGASYPAVNDTQVKQQEIAYPQIEEQKYIVATLDKAFASISQAVTNAEKNLANARELFENYLNNVFTQKGEGWVEKPLENFTKSISTGPFGSLLHKSDYVTVGVPLVNPTNIVDGGIIPNPSKLIDKLTKDRLSSYVLSEGDIVIGRRGEIGRCAVIGEEQDGWICGTGSFFVRPLPDVKPDFLAHLLRSNTYSEKLESVATGAIMKNISNKALSNLLVRIPSLKIQVNILNKFSDLRCQTKYLETLYKKKLTALAELKQSILQKAFAGELH